MANYQKNERKTCKNCESESWGETKRGVKVSKIEAYLEKVQKLELNLVKKCVKRRVASKKTHFV